MHQMIVTTVAAASFAVVAMLSMTPAQAEMGGPNRVGNLCRGTTAGAPNGMYWLDKCKEEAAKTVAPRRHRHSG
jgi:hypothetical protein